MQFFPEAHLPTPTASSTELDLGGVWADTARNSEHYVDPLWKQPVCNPSTLEAEEEGLLQVYR